MLGGANIRSVRTTSNGSAVVKKLIFNYSNHFTACH